MGVLGESHFASLEIRTGNKQWELSVCLWERNRLMDVFMMRCRRYVAKVKSWLTMIANFLGGCVSEAETCLLWCLWCGCAEDATGSACQ